MGYQDILVHVPLAENRQQQDFALVLAKHFKAHLTGVCVLPNAAMLRSAADSPFIRINKSEVAEATEREREEAATVGRQFDAAAEQAGISHDWLTGEGEPADVLVHTARLYDLTVVEQCRVKAELLWGSATQLALSGCPTLVLPIDWSQTMLPQHALVAWNGSAQAAAAIHNALPLLKAADEVTLVAGEPRESLPLSMRFPHVEIVDYLRRHGVQVRTSDVAFPDSEAGDAILDVAETCEATLIVMGAFGRSRFREWVLGGATRQILAQMRVPVFMAH